MTTNSENTDAEPTKPEVVRKALGVTVVVFVCSLFLFVGVVILIVKFATKSGST